MLCFFLSWFFALLFLLPSLRLRLKQSDEDEDLLEVVVDLRVSARPWVKILDGGGIHDTRVFETFGDMRERSFT